MADLLPAVTKSKSVDKTAKKLDPKECHALIAQYTPYVRSIAGKIKKTLAKEIDFEDLIEYGMLGLLEAAERYDADVGANFMTFAYYRIRGAIYDGLRGMGWLSRSEYARVRLEEKANTYLAQVSEENVAQAQASPDAVQDLARVASHINVIFMTALDGLEGMQLKDPNAIQADEQLSHEQARIAVHRAMDKLNDQERTLVDLYYYHDFSLQEVGEKLGLSKSWTSRLHARTIEKLQRLLGDELKDATG